MVRAPLVVAAPWPPVPMSRSRPPVLYTRRREILGEVPPRMVERSPSACGWRGFAGPRSQRDIGVDPDAGRPRCGSALTGLLGAAAVSLALLRPAGSLL